VVTRDVPSGMTVVGMPARSIALRRHRSGLASDRNPHEGGEASPTDA
jgi:serine acetyltransferase